MIANAEYWLSFDLAAFEPLLAKCPSPLREFGVAVALRFGDGVDGMLDANDLARAKETVLEGELTDALRAGLTSAFETLDRAVKTRDRLSEIEAAGFRRYT